MSAAQQFVVFRFDALAVQFLLDTEADTLVREVFKGVPDLVKTWNQLAAVPVVKADLFRYAILYAYGGLCADPPHLGT